MALGEAFVSKTGTTYLVVHEHVPRVQDLAWFDSECDAFVAILDGVRLTDDVADKVATGLVALPTDWIETMGSRSEALHDRIDATSVAIGRQPQVGNGDPMTAWHDDKLDLRAMVEWIALGGHGAADCKLVVVVGSAKVALKFEGALRQIIGA